MKGVFIFRSLLFWLLAPSLAAFIWPADEIGLDPFAASKALLWPLIVVTMFSLGTLVRDDDLRPLIERPWWVALGLIPQMLAMPLIAWLVIQVCGLEGDIAAGVFLVGCVPGAMASNVLTLTAGGSVAYSVSLTTVATLLSPVTVPLALTAFSSLTDQTPKMTPVESAVKLFLQVVLPTIAGYVAARKSLRLRDLADRWGAFIASFALLWIIAAVVAGSRDYLVDVGIGLVLILLVINVLGYLAGYLTGKVAQLPNAQRKALTLEVGMQNAGLGTALAKSLFGAESLIPTAAYTFGCMVTGTCLAIWWRTKRSCDEIESRSGEPTEKAV